jgi:glycosyltransferase involved in cell wall biosynthesis
MRLGAEMMPAALLDPSRPDSPLPDDARRLKRVLCALRLDPAGKFGSLEEQALTLARSFRAQGSLFLPVYLRPLDAESASQYACEGLEVEALDLSSFQLTTLRRLLGLIRRHRIEIVHWNFYHPLANAYLWVLSTLKPRLEHYYTDHISRPGVAAAPARPRGWKSRLKRILVARYRKVLCVSDYIQDEARATAGLRAERIHHFVNTERFRPDPEARREVRRVLGVDAEFVALVVAHLIKDKGIDVALRAVAQLPEDIMLWVVGQGREQGDLEALAGELGLGRRARFLGPRRHVEPLMQAADSVVCPSVWAEAAGLVNLEAMACGLPVVASRIGGIPEFIEDGRNGFLFTPGDHRELAGRIRQLFEAPELRQRMGQDGRALVVERHSRQSLLNEHLEIYRGAPTRR